MPAAKGPSSWERFANDKNTNGGYNAATEEYVDMIKAGIIDPTKVSRTALQNAASVAGLMLTTEVMITDIPEEKKEPAGGGWPQPRHGRDVLKESTLRALWLSEVRRARRATAGPFVFVAPQHRTTIESPSSKDLT